MSRKIVQKSKVDFLEGKTQKINFMLSSVSGIFSGRLHKKNFFLVFKSFVQFKMDKNKLSKMKYTKSLENNFFTQKIPHTGLTLI